MEKCNKKKNRNPREGVSIFSIVSFAWLWKFFRIGYKRKLEHSDLFAPLDCHASQLICKKLEKKFKIEVEECRKNKAKCKPKFWMILGKCFGTEIIVIGILQLILELLLTLPQPIIISKLLKYFDGSDAMSKTDAYYWAGLFSVLYILKSPFYHLSIHSAIHLGMKTRVSCCSLIYRKVLKISKLAEDSSSAGQIVNLLTNDVNALDYAFYFFHYIWISPIIVIIVAYITYVQIELPALTGIILYMIIIPLQGFIGKFVPRLSMQAAFKTDKRLQLMKEIIGGVEVIKMYAWEKPFSLLVDKARLKELSALKKNLFIDAIAMSFETYASRLCVYVTIITYAFLGNHVTAEKVFMIAAFYNDLRYSMGIAFPLGILRLAKALAAVKRIEEFMELEEIQESVHEDSKTFDAFPLDTDVNKNPTTFSQNTSDNSKNSLTTPQELPTTKELQNAVILQNASCKWSQESTEYTLKDINFTAKRGALTSVIGQVGSGKTSLFHVILKELALTSGSLKVTGKVVYVSQKPWIFASSVRQNILFGRPMDKQRYNEVIKVCQLETDFIMFPDKDQTIIGEKGINLSGGQKARINLARAVYADADIYLLDDPLSAVDTNVGRTLFETCICKFLNRKTRILISHQRQFLNSVEYVYVLNNGTIKIDGTFQELMKSEIKFSSILQVLDQVEKGKNDKKMTLQSDPVARDVTSEEIREEDDEHMEFGKISQKVYWAYFKAVGSMWFVVMFLAILVTWQLIASSGDIILANWVDAENVASASTNKTEAFFEMEQRQWYIHVYTGIIVGTILSVYIKSFVYHDICIKSSRNLHSNMFCNIIRSTMTFFHSNHSGRIINRFSKDIGIVDKDLPSTLNDVLETFCFFVAVMVMTLTVNFWMLLPTLFIGIVFYFLKSIYTKTSRSAKRLEGISRSPVICHLSDTLHGLTTIRAFGAQELLTKEFDNHQDIHSASYFLSFSCSRAFGYYLEVTCAVYLTIVICSFLLLLGNESVGKVGLIITQSASMAGFLQWGIVQATEVENQMISVERIMKYTNVPKEPPLESTPENKPPANWPSKGCVEFRNVSLSYSEGGDFILKNLSFILNTTEKVGIVGRTGAGKSSLIHALFRLAYVNGEIYIDDVATSKLGLHDLRSKISIIPQEPFLFAGTLRENLDPFQEYSDDKLWEALNDVELKESVSEFSLYGKVSDGGSNFSVGQRQLLCLARAILKKNKLLVLDEATANVDQQTDALIQKTIRKRFENCTVFIIAHRLNTVMDCDKFIVMDAGHLVEFDHPHILLQQRNGYLYKMVQQTGLEMANVLTTIAEDCYNNAVSSIA